jgi:cell division septal protein FtsQ
VLFKAENIYVNGNKYYPEDTIIRLAGVREGDNIFVASMFGNKKAIRDNLPYVKSAGISFQLPNSIVIDVENAKEAQCVKTDGMYFKVSDENRILEQMPKKSKKLTSLVAPALKSTKVGDKVEFKDDSYTKALNSLTECIKKNQYPKITEINIRRISDISITYDKRIKIKIGLPEALDYKLKTAFAIIREKLDPNHTGKIKGVLNVSKCDKTKKSYFKEGSIKEKDEDATVPSASTTAETTVRSTFVAVKTEAPPEENYDQNDEGDNENSDEQYATDAEE